MKNRSRFGVRIMILLLAVLILMLVSFKPAQRNYNVILISIDTLRADHLGLYGYHRNTSPNIDTLGKDSMVFENAMSQASWTLPSHASLFTSLYPPEIFPFNLSVQGSEDYFFSMVRKEYMAHDNIASILKSNNYSTAAFVSGGYVARRFGFDKGFDIYDDSHLDMEYPYEYITPQVLGWLKANGTRKFFLFAHYFDVHSPYVPDLKFQKYYLLYNGELDLSRDEIPGFREYFNFTTQEGAYNNQQVKRIIAGYDDSITQVDDSINQILGYLKKSGLYENTIIIIFADHGEALFNHTGSKYYEKDFPNGHLGHRAVLFNEVLRVPLLIKYPNAEPRRVPQTVRLIDVLPTVLDILNLDTPGNISGKTLLGRVEDRDYLSVKGPAGRMPYGGYAAKYGNFKLIVKTNKDNTTDVYLYDLKKDPDELVDLAPSKPEIVEILKSQLLGNLSVMLQKTAIKDYENYTVTEGASDILEVLKRQGY